MSAKTPNLSDFRRIVVKVGSSLLVDAAAGKLKEAWLLSLAADIAKLHSEGRDIIVVSSGSIALGRSVLKLPKGEFYQRVETARGELGVYIVSDGAASPYRIKYRSPNFSNLSALERMATGTKIGDLVAIMSTIDLVIPDVDR